MSHTLEESAKIGEKSEGTPQPAIAQIVEQPNSYLVENPSPDNLDNYPPHILSLYVHGLIGRRHADEAAMAHWRIAEGRKLNGTNRLAEEPAGWRQPIIPLKRMTDGSYIELIGNYVSGSFSDETTPQTVATPRVSHPCPNCMPITPLKKLADGAIVPLFAPPDSAVS